MLICSLGNDFVLFGLMVIDMKKIKCDKCKKFYHSKDVHSILGVLVCVHCYPDGSKYCDCCSDDKYSNEYDNKKYENDENVNRKLF